MILYVNACVRRESRTDRIARALLERIGGEPIEEVRLIEENLRPMTGESVNRRIELIRQRRFDDPIFRWARQFAKADTIVIGAPFWDNSFPSILKIYLENVYAVDVVTAYDGDGRPHGLCRAKKLYYVSTAGGPFIPDYGFHYFRSLAQTCFGIPDVELICAEMLDIDGVDADAVVNRVIETLRSEN